MGGIKREISGGKIELLKDIENKTQGQKRKMDDQQGTQDKHRRRETAGDISMEVANKSFDEDRLQQQNGENDDNFQDIIFKVKLKFNPKVRKIVRGGRKMKQKVENNVKITAFFKPSLARDKGGGEEQTRPGKGGGVGTSGRYEAKISSKLRSNRT